jgi:hypothetical protein
MVADLPILRSRLFSVNSDRRIDSDQHKSLEEQNEEHSEKVNDHRIHVRSGSVNSAEQTHHMPMVCS